MYFFSIFSCTCNHLFIYQFIFSQICIIGNITANHTPSHWASFVLMISLCSFLKISSLFHHDVNFFNDVGAKITMNIAFYYNMIFNFIFRKLKQLYFHKRWDENNKYHQWRIERVCKTGCTFRCCMIKTVLTLIIQLLIMVNSKVFLPL